MTPESVLFVVYDFPPEGARGTKRSLKFIRHLPQSGWSAVVLTVRGANSCFHDSSLLSEIPSEVAIYRARTLESLFKRNDPGPAEEQEPTSGSRNGRKTSGFRRAVRWLYQTVGTFTSVPDSRILWLPFAVAMGVKIIRQRNCRVIYTSGPSHTNHLVGAILSRLTRLPLVMDFRDAWVGNPVRGTGRRWLVGSNAILERFCVSSAGFVISTTDGMRADFENRYSRFSARNLTITNGFDPSDFPPAEPVAGENRPRRLTIVHAGTLGGERSPKEFLLALGQLLRKKPDLANQIEVVFVGQSSPFFDGRTIENYVSDFECGSVVRLAGYVSRKASLDYMRQADVLLLIIGRVPKEGAFIYGISGKIYDYAAARKPVLTIAEPGSTADIAQRLNLGPVAHPDDVEQIEQACLGLYDAHKSGSIPYHPNLELLKSFEFSSLAARLAGCFEVACASRKSRV